jgi:hypothetical protein
MTDVKNFLDAAFAGDLQRVQKMLADGDARKTDANVICLTALLSAAQGGSRSFPTMIWLLEEGGARITERDHGGYSALHMAASNGNLTACQWLLEHGGADIAEVTCTGKTVWSMIVNLLHLSSWHVFEEAELPALLRVLVVRGAPPADFVAKLGPQHAQVFEEGARLRTALSVYLVRWRAIMDAHCPLIAPLLALVHDDDPKPTTTEELWATGLGTLP